MSKESSRMESKFFSQNDQVSSNSIKNGYTRQKTPPIKTQSGKQPNALFVVSEDKSKNSIYSESWALIQNFLQYLFTYSLPSEVFMKINANLSSCVVCRPSKRVEDLPITFHHQSQQPTAVFSELCA